MLKANVAQLEKHLADAAVFKGRAVAEATANAEKQYTNIIQVSAYSTHYGQCLPLVLLFDGFFYSRVGSPRTLV